MKNLLIGFVLGFNSLAVSYLIYSKIQEEQYYEDAAPQPPPAVYGAPWNYREYKLGDPEGFYKRPAPVKPENPPPAA